MEMIEEEDEALLTNKGLPEVERNLIQEAIRQTFQSTASLANLLPTGSALCFQLLAPIFTNQGECDAAGRGMTAALVGLCAFSCVLLCFTDSIKDQKGSVCYGFATFNGIWIIDGSATLPPEIAAKYKLKFIDFAHAVMSMLVFAAVALFDENVVKCLWPEPSTGTKEVLTALPVGIGVVCSMLFLVFPTKRHGIGFPLTDT
ncbi:LOW QUALITY PROTEIN: protein DMP6 [Salvia miltiorrhiza]|uniref:LOW QUALITY PROTEIN: protein DMP6 n=1 Tax=Salvia miltiorrhiza TaxID=226208 RepID=UPI0025AD7907|nr:LOW QUALITY PROTEIN: protein DMP6 [Salvia miltiorrhiza]